MDNIDCKPLVRVENLKKHFEIPHKGKLHAVDGVSFEIYPGETLGLVGESGCGKSTVGNLIMRLHKATDGKVFYNKKAQDENGEDAYREIDVLNASSAQQKEICTMMQIIFQDPYSSLNPKQTIHDIIAAPFIVHGYQQGSVELEEKILKVCEMVDISTDILNLYPHELDGGMRQVVGIARALSLNPGFVVCDEPVSALDVSVQAKIINLLMELQKKNGYSYLFISHDLSVVRHISNRISVMYLGQIVEVSETDNLFANSLHPYTIALLSAVPRVNVDAKVNRIVLGGDVPSPMNPEPGCRFEPRCWMSCKDEKCKNCTPELTEVEPGHFVACHHYNESRELIREAERSSLNI